MNTVERRPAGKVKTVALYLLAIAMVVGIVTFPMVVVLGAIVVALGVGAFKLLGRA